MVHLPRRAASVPPRPSAEPLCAAQEQEVEDGRYVQSLQRKLELGHVALEFDCPAQQQEAEDGRYVQSLQKKLEPIFACKAEPQKADEYEESTAETNAPSEEITSEGESSEMSAEDKPKCNPGSAGHPELCRRPCIYFALGQCINLADCNFCHLPHNNRSATLDKNQRQVIKEMSQHEFLSVVTRCLQSKAVEGGFELEAQDVLQLFKAQLGQLRATPSKVPKTKVMNFEKALARMTFFSVASLTSRVNLSSDFIDTCKERVVSLRQRLAE
ncbi:unnamed protein product [Symbiodinium natans]|uniref:C3H1-type domain-containing protein n=1 Tax=Symbiodinium natans TaxID=878477 RepID=A0A812PJB1_9DINO|nr:unnamed protein product [Symbiodinium natans]